MTTYSIEWLKNALSGIADSYIEDLTNAGLTGPLADRAWYAVRMSGRVGEQWKSPSGRWFYQSELDAMLAVLNTSGVPCPSSGQANGAWTAERVLEALRATKPTPNNWGVRAACQSAFGSAAGVAIRAYERSTACGELHKVGGHGSFLNDGALDAMAKALNDAGYPEPGESSPGPLTLDELVEALRATMPSGRTGERFNEAFGRDTALRDLVSTAYCNAEATGEKVSFEGCARGAYKVELEAVLKVVNEAGWRPGQKPIETAAPKAKGHAHGCGCGACLAAHDNPPCTTCGDRSGVCGPHPKAEAPKADPYVAARIQRLYEATTHMSNGGIRASTTAEATVSCLRALAFYRAKAADVAVAIRTAETALAECGDPIALAEHGRKAGGS